MTSWQQIVSSAIVGTDRLPVLPSLADPPLLAWLPSAEKESTLLSAAALLSLRRRAGWLPEQVAVEGELIAASAAEDRPVVSREAARHLKTLLAGEHVLLLREWLRAVDRAGRIVPPELLPRLLARAKPQRLFMAMGSLAAVIGKRGVWLMEQKPEWRNLELNLDAAVWETGNAGERVAWLTAKRVEDPIAARAALEEGISKESAAVRAEFVGALANGLSLADEPFLEATLDDKSKEVRKTAASLLCRLPGSQWVERMSIRAEAALRYQPGGLLRSGKLEVSLPESLDNAMKRDGIDPSPYAARKQLGERAAILMLIIAGVPPTRWEEAFGTAPRAILKLAMDHEWAEALLSGWAMATTHFGNAAWATAILTAGIPESKLLVPIADIASSVPAAEREAFILRIFAEPRGTTKEMEEWLTSLSPVLQTFDELPESVATGLLPIVKKLLGSEKPSWSCAAIIHELALRLSLSACSRWIEAIGQISEENLSNRQIQKTTELLVFRTEMHRAILESDL